MKNIFKVKDPGSKKIRILKFQIGITIIKLLVLIAITTFTVIYIFNNDIELNFESFTDFEAMVIILLLLIFINQD